MALIRSSVEIGMELEGSWAIVTGGAKRLGREIALGLARRGANLVVHHGHSPEEAERTVSEIRGLGVEAIAVQADLREPESIDRLFDRAAQRCDRLKVMVNSAASFVRQGMMDASVWDWDGVVDLNLRAPWLCMRRFAALMSEAGEQAAESGVVINISDLTGVQAWPGYSHHGVSKAGLIHLTKIAARELAPGIRVNCVVPGAILPPPGMSDTAPGWLEKVERLPLKRAGDPGAISDTVDFLVQNHFITGAVLVVDGGEHLLGGQAVE